MLENISDAFFTLMKVFAVYFTVISIFAFFRPKTIPETEKRLRFAVLVPARNEESCISAIVESLLTQNYTANLADIYVIPNNCTDGTEGAAKRSGANILRVSPEVHSKGEALHEACELLLASDKNYDAFCVFDADNEADPNFLSAMNKALCSGARVAKSRIVSKNRDQSWVCACYDIYFCSANLFLNRARSVIGLSARLIGTGFAVRRDFLEELDGFNTETITEDAEFFAVCAARGEKIAFCEDALTYDEEPLSFKTSLIQRRRWMSGIMQVTRLKFAELCSGLLHRRSFIYSFDVLMQFCFSYIQAVLPFMVLLVFIADPAEFTLAIPLSLMTAYIGSAANALLALLLQKRLTAAMIPGILMYPVFVFSFIPLQTVSLFKRTTSWQEIRHSGVRRFHSEKVPGFSNDPVLPEYVA
jgi:cellulose synthase/poly-beta-1,6-N-acetylglucosamine synthase-like glycosyltransferase